MPDQHVLSDEYDELIGFGIDADDRADQEIGFGWDPDTIGLDVEPTRAADV